MSTSNTSGQDGGLVYSVVEPQLSDDETNALRIIENAFEKLVSTNVELIDAGQREIYLHDRFYSLMHIFGLKLNDAQKQRMFFHLKKNYLGYGRIDTLMKDKYIEDISCNGSNMNIYVQHRTYGSIRTNVQFGEIEAQQLCPETRTGERPARFAPPADPGSHPAGRQPCQYYSRR